MSLIFTETEKLALRLLIDSRSTQKPEDFLTSEELSLLDSNNYREASWLRSVHFMQFSVNFLTISLNFST